MSAPFTTLPIPTVEFSASGERGIVSVSDTGANPALADNLSEVEGAIVQSRLVILPDGDFDVSQVPVNELGTEWIGGGRLRKAITGGRQQLNLSGSRATIFGQEYLHAWHKAIRDHTTGAGPLLSFLGDSTTTGSGGNGATAPFLLHQLAQGLAAERGFMVTTANRGNPGKDTYEWYTDGTLTADLATNPKLMVIRYGLNNPTRLVDHTLAPANSGQEYPGRRGAAEFASDLRAALTIIRASKPLSTTSIVLMTPNTCNDTPNARDEVFLEEARHVVAQVAREFQCAFVDTYALWVDARNFAADERLDNPYGDGRGIHPDNIFNVWISEVLANLLFPQALRMRFTPSTVALQVPATTPAQYAVGLNLGRCSATEGWPGTLNGAVETTKTPDGIARQLVYPYNVNKMPYERWGNGGAWGRHTSHGRIALTPLNGWVLGYPGVADLVATMHGGRVLVSGHIKDGTVTAGTVLFTLPDGWRPVSPDWFVVPTGTLLTSYATIQIGTDGSVVINGGATTQGLAIKMMFDTLF